ncbi:hypothetical protein SBBP2_1030001 [Burkholderiales bacterium]|jgi:hypothetical protein|nr:hypothetical protein SBBP2_1030001 [Burkholderiales bacterium]
MNSENFPPQIPFWERPPPQWDGDEFSEPIFLGVGIALSKWEIVETFFAMIFKHLIESRSNAAGRVFYRLVMSSCGKLDTGSIGRGG